MGLRKRTTIGLVILVMLICCCLWLGIGGRSSPSLNLLTEEELAHAIATCQGEIAFKELASELAQRRSMAVQPLIHVLQNGNSTQSQRAAVVLGMIGQDAVGPLAAELDNPNLNVKREVIIALAGLGAKSKCTILKIESLDLETMDKLSKEIAYFRIAVGCCPPENTVNEKPKDQKESCPPSTPREGDGDDKKR